MRTERGKARRSGLQARQGFEGVAKSPQRQGEGRGKAPGWQGKGNISIGRSPLGPKGTRG